MTAPGPSPEPSPAAPPPVSPPAPVSRLKPIRARGSILAWAIAGAFGGGLGLLLLTGLAGTPWLFLLYPVLIALTLVSLSVIVLHLLHRL